jgi:hypothetical protein
MRRLLALAVLAGCTPPAVPAPAPVQMSAALPPARVASIAAQALTLDGFTVIASDASAGVVSAAFVRSGKGDWGPLVTCRLGPDAIGRTDATMTLTARISAVPTDSGSTVVIAAEALTTFGPNSFLARTGGAQLTNDATMCVSSGLAERHIADAITGHSR